MKKTDGTLDLLFRLDDQKSLDNEPCVGVLNYGLISAYQLL